MREKAKEFVETAGEIQVGVGSGQESAEEVVVEKNSRTYEPTLKCN